MITLKATLLSTIAALALITPAVAEASPSGRASVQFFNPETGNAGRIGGFYNRETGARSFRAWGYDASTDTYQGGTRAYDPSTGKGFTTSTQAARGSGITTTINTLNNGSYTCSISRDLPGRCVEDDLNL